MSKLTINDLPNEILKHIFSFVNSCARKRLKSVCSRWEEIVDVTLGDSHYIGSGGSVWEHNIDWEPLQTIKQLGMSSCHLSNIDLNLVSDDEKQPHFLRPYLIKWFSLVGEIPSDYYMKLTKPLVNVATIDLHLSSLSFLTFDSDYLLPCFRQLKQLYLTSEGFDNQSISPYVTTDLKTAFYNIMILLKPNYTCLNTLSINLPFFLDKEIQFTTEMIHFVARHKETLRKFTLMFRSEWRIDTNNDNIRQYHEGIEIFSALETNLKHIKLTELWKGVNLSSFKWTVEDNSTPTPSSTYWKFLALIAGHVKMSRFIYMCDVFIPLPVETLQKYCTTLKKIGLTLDIPEQTQIDLTVFKSCTVLQSLWLKSKRSFDVSLKAINATSLPKSLTELRFWRLTMTTEDCDFIVLKLKCLKILTLCQIGGQENFGMSYSCLLDIFRLKKLQRIMFLSSLNKSTLPTNVQEESYELDASYDTEILSTMLRHDNNHLPVVVLDKKLNKYVYLT